MNWVPVGGSGDCICDWSGATGGDTPVDGGGGVSVWASALPVSRANPSAAIADDLMVFIVLLPVGDFRAAFPFPDTTRELGHKKAGQRPLGLAWPPGVLPPLKG
jgi:hypothetical protein